jgi:hypothetical protein
MVARDLTPTRRVSQAIRVALNAKQKRFVGPPSSATLVPRHGAVDVKLSDLTQRQGHEPVPKEFRTSSVRQALLHHCALPARGTLARRVGDPVAQRSTAHRSQHAALAHILKQRTMLALSSPHAIELEPRSHRPLLIRHRSRKHTTDGAA